MDESLAEEMVWFVDAWRVHQYQLGLRGGEDGAQPVAGGLGDWRGDRHLLAHQVIEQGGFAHVGPPNQGHEARSKAFWALAQLEAAGHGLGGQVAQIRKRRI